MSELIIPNFAQRELTLGDWTLYMRQFREGQSPLWPSFRLMLPPGTPSGWGRTRVYDMAWNPLELRFARSAASQALERHEPDMYARIVLHLTLNYGPEWLTDPAGAGLTPAGLDAELARLRALHNHRRSGRYRRRAT